MDAGREISFFLTVGFLVAFLALISSSLVDDTIVDSFNFLAIDRNLNNFVEELV
jgi:hypothetical protein